MKKPTQRELITDYINRFGSISPMEAIADLGITKLATRVSEMKKDGIEFKIVLEKGKNRYGKPTFYARYYWKEKEDGRKTNVCENNN